MALMNDYDRIVRTLKKLEQTSAECADLPTLARAAGTLPSAFCRLFARWTATPSQDPLRFLTLADLEERRIAKRRAGADTRRWRRRRAPRVDLVAATREEIRSGGAGWTIEAGLAKSPFGTCLIAVGPKGICVLAFPSSKDWKRAAEMIRNEWPRARLRRADAAARKWAARLFALPRKQRSLAPLRAFARGSPFQLRVWRELLRVPSGALISYGELARAAGSPGAARAVGSAMARNPIAWLIPCHRVIRGTKDCGNYGGGRLRKRAMLAWEGASL